MENSTPATAAENVEEIAAESIAEEMNEPTVAAEDTAAFVNEPTVSEGSVAAEFENEPTVAAVDTATVFEDEPTMTPDQTTPASEEDAPVSADGAALVSEADVVLSAQEEEATVIAESAAIEDEATVAEAAPVQAASVAAAAALAAKNGQSHLILLTVLSSVGLVLLLIAGILIGVRVDLSTAQKMFDDGNFAEAKKIYEKYSNYDAYERMPYECDYALAEKIMDEGSYLAAHRLFDSLGGFKDSRDRSKEALYAYAEECFEMGDYKNAVKAYKNLDDYKDSAEKLRTVQYAYGEQLLEEGDYDGAWSVFCSIKDFSDAEARADQCMIAKGIAQYEQGDYFDAVTTLEPYVEDSEEAFIYYNLATFEDCSAEGMEYADADVFEALSPYYGKNDLVTQALEDPYFYFVRFYGAAWRCGSYTLNADNRDKTIYYDLPWDSPEGAPDYECTPENVEVYVEEEFWFTITGFDAYDQKHPDKMYITDPDGKEYVFNRYRVYDD